MNEFALKLQLSECFVRGARTRTRVGVSIKRYTTALPALKCYSSGVEEPFRERAPVGSVLTSAGSIEWTPVPFRSE